MVLQVNKPQRQLDIGIALEGHADVPLNRAIMIAILSTAIGKQSSLSREFNDETTVISPSLLALPPLQSQ